MVVGPTTISFENGVLAGAEYRRFGKSDCTIPGPVRRWLWLNGVRRCVDVTAISVALVFWGRLGPTLIHCRTWGSGVNLRHKGNRVLAVWVLG